MISDDKVKQSINYLIDYKKTNNRGFSPQQINMRNHGIDLAIINIKSNLLNIIEWEGEDNKFETELINL